MPHGVLAVGDHGGASLVELAPNWAMLVDVGRNASNPRSPNVPKFGRLRLRFGQSRAECGRSCRTFGRLGPRMAALGRIGPTLGGFGSIPSQNWLGFDLSQSDYANGVLTHIRASSTDKSL